MTLLRVVSQLLWHTTQWIDLLQNVFLHVLVSSALAIAISQAYRAASQHYGSAWGGNFLMGLAIAAPAAALACGAIALAQDQGIWIVLLLVVPVAIFLGTRWSVMLPSILLEDLGAQAGLGRSWALTEGFFGKVFGTSFAIGILVILLATLPQLAVMYGLGLLLPNVDIVSLVETVLAQVSLILTMPVSVGVTVVLYYDLRVHKEAFDLELQVQQASATE